MPDNDCPSGTPAIPSENQPNVHVDGDVAGGIVNVGGTINVEKLQVVFPSPEIARRQFAGRDKSLRSRPKRCVP